MTGGSGSNAGPFFQPFSGGEAVRYTSSGIAVLNCELRGSHGASGPNDNWSSDGCGGHDVWIFDSDAIIAGGATIGGDGGSGVFLTWGRDAAFDLTVRDHAVIGGDGGGTICGFGGNNARLNLTGQPGDLFFALLGPQASSFDFIPSPAPLVLGNLWGAVGPLSVDASGVAIHPVPIPIQGPSFGGVTLAPAGDHYAHRRAA